MSLLKKSFQLLPPSDSKYHDVLILLALIIIGATSSVDFFINKYTFFHAFWLFGLVLLMTLLFNYSTDKKDN